MIEALCLEEAAALLLLQLRLEGWVDEAVLQQQLADALSLVHRADVGVLGEQPEDHRATGEALLVRLRAEHVGVGHEVQGGPPDELVEVRARPRLPLPLELLLLPNATQTPAKRPLLLEVVVLILVPVPVAVCASCPSSSAAAAAAQLAADEAARVGPARLARLPSHPPLQLLQADLRLLAYGHKASPPRERVVFQHRPSRGFVVVLVVL
mmetsp:Transcript_18584/g.45610  ORF Transcript_18584/g.45610 Transcript_18584/m.45610 type:complete len:210 (-) Transcript_18584:295-924(-)